MACLALALQPVNGSDVLLQTREWFPPARAAYATSSFRTTRVSYSGDDALSTSSGQVVVGKENKYRIVYRLVNTIYVLGITSTDQDDPANNIFECANIVNQAVSVLVAACKGIDVSADRLSRKYTEIYMTLDAVLHGVSAARLGFILSSIHGDNVAQIVLSAAEAENRARGADSWNQVKGYPVERLANVEVLANTTFEIPEETLAAGDEVAATLAPQTQASTSLQQEAQAQKDEEKPEDNEDPFAASDAIQKGEALAGGFKKSKETTSDINAALAELQVTNVVTAAAATGTAESTFVGVEGFEGEYGGLEFEEDGFGGGFGDGFEGLSDAFGGGLDASEYASSKDMMAKPSGLSGLEELEGGGGTKSSSTTAAPGLSTAPPAAAPSQDAHLVVAGAHGGAEKVKGVEADSRRPLVWLTEEISAEFNGLVLTRTGLEGTLHLKTALPSTSTPHTDAEFSFLLEGAAGIKNGVVHSTIASSLGHNYFHVRTPPSGDSLTILKYRLQPRFTPLPLRMRLLTRKVGFLLSVMVQYVANPYLPSELKDVTFLLTLPFSPPSLKVSPRASLDRTTRQIRWQVAEIGMRSTPGRLRAQFPVEEEEEEERELKLKVSVEFNCEGQTLSGVSVRPATSNEGSKERENEFYVGQHSFKSSQYVCS